VSALLEPHELARYADAVVHACIGLDEDELLVVNALPSQRELAVALAESAFRAGARDVELAYVDPLVAAARMRYAADSALGPLPPWSRMLHRAQLAQSSASVTVLPDAEPGAFDGIPPERVAGDFAARQAKLGWFQQASMRGDRRWNVVAWPTSDWAAQVYPELVVDEGRRRLARDLLWFCRLGPDDPPGFEGWAAHAALLDERCRALTALRLTALQVRDRGTSLDFSLAPGTRWLGGPRETSFGKMVTPNFPTEESFTSPVAASTAGTFRCSLPLYFRGRTIDGIAGELRGGRLVRLDAARDDDREFLASALDVDRGARRLGEVALVDRSSRIGLSGRVYFNTLLDENASAHIAFGRGYDQTRLPDPGARGPRGVNRSALHLDVMIGTDALEASGVAEGGRRVPLVKEGEWQIP
jgi:aminopeptidase